jgi:transposase
MSTAIIAVDDISTIALHAEHIYVGIDVSKNSHIAAFLSAALLAKHRRFEACPTLPFANSRQGFEQLVTAMKFHGPLTACSVLVERTGHYHRALVEYLQEQGIAIYEVQVSKRPSKLKTDKRDAQGLANALYNQRELHVQCADPSQEARRVLPASPVAAFLSRLVRHRYELGHEETQRRNRLTAIADQLFPEITDVFKDPNKVTALSIRSAFPTPAAVAAASLEDLLTHRRANFPGNAAFAELRELAAHSIGCKEPGRIQGLCIEQSQLITELQLIQSNIAALDAEIERVVSQSREGKILTSMPMIGPVHAAEILAAIGSIANFESPEKLKGFFGWSPMHQQTGISLDKMTLTRGGSRPLKKALYLIAWRCVKGDTEWRAIYDRLVPLKCQWDERKQQYRGRNKVMGRICGQIITMIYVLLRRDYDLLATLKEGEEVPEPVLYDREIHHAHRTGGMHRGRRRQGSMSVTDSVLGGRVLR